MSTAVLPSSDKAATAEKIKAWTEALTAKPDAMAEAVNQHQGCQGCCNMHADRMAFTTLLLQGRQSSNSCRDQGMD